MRRWTDGKFCASTRPRAYSQRRLRPRPAATSSSRCDRSSLRDEQPEAPRRQSILQLGSQIPAWSVQAGIRYRTPMRRTRLGALEHFDSLFRKQFKPFRADLHCTLASSRLCTTDRGRYTKLTKQNTKTQKKGSREIFFVPLIASYVSFCVFVYCSRSVVQSPSPQGNGYRCTCPGII